MAFCMCSYGQTISHTTNSPRCGDVIMKKPLAFFSSSNEGQGVLWNFSDIVADGNEKEIIDTGIKKLKEQILARDNTTCQICGISKQVFDAYAEGLGDYLLLEIDHIKPVASGGRGDDANNLQVLCWRCNRKKTNKRTNNEVSAMIDYGIKYLPLINMDMKGGDNNDSKTNAKT